MSIVKVSGNASGTGTLTIAAPNTNSDVTINLPTVTGGEFVVSNSSGNVGIGTSAPGQRLEISNASTNTTFSTVGNQLLIRNSGTTADAYARVDFAGGSSNNPTASIAAQIKNYGTGATELVFGTFNTGAGTIAERARIDTSGNLLVGTTTAGLTNSNSVTLQTNGPGGVLVANHSGTASGSAYTFFAYNGSSIGGITQNGTTAVAYNTSSDYRLKNTIAPMTGALAKVAALRPCTYKWNADGSDGEGFIAHELAEVVPQCVTGEKDAVDAEGNPVYQGIDTSFLVATLTAAIKELKAIVDAQGAEIAALKGQA